MGFLVCVVIGFIVAGAVSAIVAPLFMMAGIVGPGVTSIAGGIGTLAGVATFIYCLLKLG